MKASFVTLIVAAGLVAGCVTTPVAAPYGGGGGEYYDTPGVRDGSGYNRDDDYEDAAEAFYDDLAPYGSWIRVDGLGRVWRPSGMPPGWRPYTSGHWAWGDLGATWVSDWDWGWAPFHYGRWTRHRAHGWVWLPGLEWAPAWVVWRSGGGWVGWAPMPPAGGGSYLVHDVHVEPYDFCFIEERYLVEPRLHRHIVPIGRNVTVVSLTRNVTNYARVDRRIANRSLDRWHVERVAGRHWPHHDRPYRYVDRHRSRPRDRDYDRYRDRDGDRYRDRDGDRYRDRDGDRYRDRNGDRYRDRNGDRDRDRGSPRNGRDDPRVHGADRRRSRDDEDQSGRAGPDRPRSGAQPRPRTEERPFGDLGGPRPRREREPVDQLRAPHRDAATGRGPENRSPRNREDRTRGTPRPDADRVPQTRLPPGVAHFATEDQGRSARRDPGPREGEYPTEGRSRRDGAPGGRRSGDAPSAFGSPPRSSERPGATGGTTGRPGGAWTGFGGRGEPRQQRDSRNEAAAARPPSAVERGRSRGDSDKAGQRHAAGEQARRGRDSLRGLEIAR